MYACNECQRTHNTAVRQFGRCGCACHTPRVRVERALDSHLEADYDEANGDE